jgi:hypothetical protein
MLKHSQNVIFEVLRAVKMSMLIFRAEEGDSVFLQNVDVSLQVHTALQPRRSTLTHS